MEIAEGAAHRKRSKRVRQKGSKERLCSADGFVCVIDL